MEKRPIPVANNAAMEQSLPTGQSNDQLRAVSAGHLIDCYLQGIPVVVLASEYGIDEQQLRELIEQQTFTTTEGTAQNKYEPAQTLPDTIVCQVPRSNRVIRYEPELAEILHSLIYDWHLRLHEVVRETGLDSTALHTIINHMIEIGIFRFAHRGQREEFMETNTDFLDRPSPFRSYFIGLMITDGWITDQVQNKNTGNISSYAGINMKNQPPEEEMLQRLANVLGIPLRYYPGIISLGSRQRSFTERIRAFGIKPRKSFDTSIPPIITDTDYLAFLLGVIDGDGGPYLQTNVKHFSIALKICSASLGFLEEIARRNHLLLGMERVKVHTEKRGKTTKLGEKYANMYTIQYNYADTVRLYRLFENAGLLELGLRSKMPRVKEHIRTPEYIREIPILSGMAEESIRRVLSRAHPELLSERMRARKKASNNPS
jgi:hypothetical protein